MGPSSHWSSGQPSSISLSAATGTGAEKLSHTTKRVCEIRLQCLSTLKSSRLLAWNCETCISALVCGCLTITPRHILAEHLVSSPLSRIGTSTGSQDQTLEESPATLSDATVPHGAY
jgi:hypothetical protein